MSTIMKKYKFRKRKPIRIKDPPKGYWVLYFDGACEPVNPGGTASWGWVLLLPSGEEYAFDSGVIGSGKGMTNNVAEWAALEAGLQFVVDEKLSVPLLCRGDSMLVVRQITGSWRCHKKHLADARDRCLALLENIPNWTAQWIPREMNQRTDDLSKSY